VKRWFHKSAVNQQHKLFAYNEPCLLPS